MPPAVVSSEALTLINTRSARGLTLAAAKVIAAINNISE
jgi:hypothetical protein